MNRFIFNCVYEVNINEQILVIGYKLEDFKYDLPNLIFNLAQYTIYQNYVKQVFKEKQYNANTLCVNFKFNVKLYLNDVNRCKFLNEDESKS